MRVWTYCLQNMYWKNSIQTIITLYLCSCRIFLSAEYLTRVTRRTTLAQITTHLANSFHYFKSNASNLTAAILYPITTDSPRYPKQQWSKCTFLCLGLCSIIVPIHIITISVKSGDKHQKGFSTQLLIIHKMI